MVSIPDTVKVPLGQLKVDRQNPKHISKNQLEALAENIRRYGFIIPIIINEDLVIADKDLDQAFDTIGNGVVLNINVPDPERALPLEFSPMSNPLAYIILLLPCSGIENGGAYLNFTWSSLLASGNYCFKPVLPLDRPGQHQSAHSTDIGDQGI